MIKQIPISFLTIFLFVSILSCKSASPLSKAPRKGDEIGSGLTEAVVQGDSSETRLESALWDRLISDTDLQADRTGTIRCKFSENVSSCFTTNLKGVENILNRELSTLLRNRLISIQKRIEGENKIIAKVNCVLGGGDLPPFSDKSKIKCRYDFVRAYNESEFEGDIADEIVESLKDNSVLGDKRTELSGVFSCIFTINRIGSHCVMRRIIRGGISEDAHVLPKDVSNPFAKSILETFIEISQFSSRSVSNPSVPGEISGSISCTTDGSGIEETGRRKSVCIARL